MEKIFEGLSDDEKIVYEDLKGPSWSPEKTIELSIPTKQKHVDEGTTELNLETVKQASQDLCKSYHVNKSI